MVQIAMQVPIYGSDHNTGPCIMGPYVVAQMNTDTDHDIMVQIVECESLCSG